MVSMQGIGYRQVFEYLEGNLSLEDTIEQIKKDTRHFAKRQLTWFRRNKAIHWLIREAGDTGREILENARRIVSDFDN